LNISSLQYDNASGCLDGTNADLNAELAADDGRG
jgi:hypothetical protein